MSTKPAVYVLIHSDVYVLKFSDGEHPAAFLQFTTGSPPRARGPDIQAAR